MDETVLIVAAHPDDEILGVGGTAARHSLQGDDVYSLIIAEGITARDNEQLFGDVKGDLTELREQSNRAASELGIKPPKHLGFPDNRLDGVHLLDLIKKVESILCEIKPQIIYTHYAADLNIDHGIVHRAVLTAARPLLGSSVRAIYTFETLSSTEWGSPELAGGFSPRRYVDISTTLFMKLRALRQYEMEMRLFPHPRSEEAVVSLAQLRGTQSGFNAAEGFGVIYDLWSL